MSARAQLFKISESFYVAESGSEAIPDFLREAHQFSCCDALVGTVRRSACPVRRAESGRNRFLAQCGMIDSLSLLRESRSTASNIR